MTRAEALTCIDAIKGHHAAERALILDLYERRGWSAAGYDSWEACVTAEFGQSRSYLYRQLAAAHIEKDLSPIGDKSFSI